MPQAIHAELKEGQANAVANLLRHFGPLRIRRRRRIEHKVADRLQSEQWADKEQAAADADLERILSAPRWVHKWTKLS